MRYQVRWNKSVDKRLSQVPSYIRDKFIAWVLVVERVGVTQARQLKGYHDEPLKGERLGQRSIRLNRAYRAIYLERSDREICIVEVIEVSKHDY